MNRIKLFNIVFVVSLVAIVIGVFLIASINIETKAEELPTVTVVFESDNVVENKTIDYYEGFNIVTVYKHIEPVEETCVEEVVEESTIVNQYELSLLAHLINGEAGATYCSDEMRYYVGSVVLNRVSSDYFPDTIEEVIFQKGQYACTWNDLGTDDTLFNREPSERCWEIAEDLLTNGSVLPQEVIFQAEFTQGDGTYVAIPFLDTHYMYFCYKY